MSETGGEAACWRDRVCDDCGGVIAGDAEHACRRPVPPADRMPAEGDDEDRR